MTQAPAFAGTFRELGINPDLLSIVEHYFTQATPIQHQVIPPALKNQDVIGIAQTGTGKTLAFGIPLFQKIFSQGGQALVLLPTRELALQVEEMLQKLGKSMRLRTAVLIGGMPIFRQIKMLRTDPHIVIATPGRLMDHLQQKTYSLKRLNTIVLDEADRMLDIGFLPQIRQILSAAPVDRQTLLFSATMPTDIAEIAAQHMKQPLRVEVAAAGTPASHIEQGLIVISRSHKPTLLTKLLEQEPGSILVFMRTKHGAKKMTQMLRHAGHTAAEIHSNCSLGQRKEALSGFKSGKYRILVATDIAARGLHVNNIALVINYDLPDNPEDYVHRIGRTGRAGSTGKALTFACPDERSSVRSIEKLIRKSLEILAVPPELESIQQQFIEPARPAHESVASKRPFRRKPGYDRSRRSRFSSNRAGHSRDRTGSRSR